MITPKIEETALEATYRERGVWEEVIFREAKRCGIPKVGLSAGEVLHDMAEEIIRLRTTLSMVDKLTRLTKSLT